MAEIIREIAKFVFRLVFEVFLTLTGEIVLFILTFGKHKPRWNLYTKESPGRFVVFSELSLWIGMAFWVTVIAVLYRLLTKG